MAEPIGPDPRPTRMLRRVLALAVFSTLVCVAAPVAHVYACSCLQLGAGQALANSDVAFTGVVSRVQDANAGNPIISSADPIVYTFAAVEVVKGPAAAEVVLTSARDGDTCGITFALRDKWRVYAYADGAGGLTTSICSGNELLAENAPLPPSSPQPPAAPPTELLLAVGGLILLIGFSAWAFTRRTRGESA